MQNKNPGDIISGAYDVRDRIRTHDLLVRSQTLYPAELTARVSYRGFLESLKALIYLTFLRVQYNTFLFTMQAVIAFTGDEK